MSLINDMLRDLEARRADVSTPLQQVEIQAAPESKTKGFSKTGKPVIGLLTLVLAAVGYLGWPQYSPVLFTWYEKFVPGSVAEEVAAPEVAEVDAVDVQERVQPEAQLMPELKELLWTPAGQGGTLTLTLDQVPELSLLSQDEQRLSLVIEQLKLDKPLPPIDSALVSHFGFKQQENGVRFDLSAAQPVGFNLGVDALRYQVLIELQALTEPEPELEPSDVAEMALTAADDTPAEPAEPADAGTDANRVDTERQRDPATSLSDLTSDGESPALPVSDPEPAVLDYQAISIQRQQQSDAERVKPELIAQQAAEAVAEQVPETQAVAAPAAVQDDTEEVFAKAAASVKPLAIKRKAATRSPVEADTALARKAARLLERGEQAAAEQLLRSGITLNNAQVKSRALWAKVLLASGRRQEADQILEDGLLLAPADSGLRQLKARSLLQDGAPEQALQLLQASVPQLKDDPGFFAMRAAIYQTLGQSESAASQYYQLLQLDSTESRWWVGMAYSLEQLGRKQQALQAYQNSLQTQIDTNLRQYVTQRMQRLVDFQE